MIASSRTTIQKVLYYKIEYMQRAVSSEAVHSRLQTPQSREQHIGGYDPVTDTIC